MNRMLRVAEIAIAAAALRGPPFVLKAARTQPVCRPTA